MIYMIDNISETLDIKNEHDLDKILQSFNLTTKYYIRKLSIWDLDNFPREACNKTIDILKIRGKRTPQLIGFQKSVISYLIRC